MSDVIGRRWPGTLGRGSVVCLLTGIFCLAAAGARCQSEAPTVPDVAAAVALLEAIVPAVEGSVVSISDKTVYTDIGQEAGLRSSSELIVYREGDDILHPLTRQVLGRFETVLGVLRVAEARDGYSVAELVSGSAGGIKPGDRIRISSGRLRVAVLPAADSGTPPVRLPWMASLYAALEKSKRFSPVDPENWTLPPAPWTAEDRKRLAGEYRLDGFIQAGTTGTEGGRMLNLELFSGLTGRPLSAATLRLPPDADRQIGATPAPASAPAPAPAAPPSDNPGSGR